MKIQFPRQLPLNARVSQPGVATRIKLNPSLTSLLAPPSRITSTGRLKLDPQSTDKKLPVSAAPVTPPIPTPALTGSLQVNWVEERQASAIQLQDPGNPDIQAVSAVIDKYKDGLNSLFPTIKITNEPSFFFGSLAENGINPLTGKPYVAIFASATVAAAKRSKQTLDEKLGKVVFDESFDNSVLNNAGEQANYANQPRNAAVSAGLAKYVSTGSLAAGMREFAEKVSVITEQYADITRAFTPRVFTPQETSGIRRAYKEVLELYGIDSRYVAVDTLGGNVVDPDGSKNGTPGADGISLTGEDILKNARGVVAGPGDDILIIYKTEGLDLSQYEVSASKGANDFILASVEKGAKVAINGGLGGNDRATGLIASGGSLIARGIERLNFVVLPDGNGKLITEGSTQINVINGGNTTVESLVAAGNISYL